MRIVKDKIYKIKNTNIEKYLENITVLPISAALDFWGEQSDSNIFKIAEFTSFPVDFNSIEDTIKINIDSHVKIFKLKTYDYLLYKGENFTFANVCKIDKGRYEFDYLEDEMLIEELKKSYFNLLNINNIHSFQKTSLEKQLSKMLDYYIAQSFNLC